MRYDCSQLRRQDRQLSESEALALLRDGEYGILSIQSEDGVYGVPVNYALVGETIYLHCATEGRKLQLIERNPQVSFCVVGQVSLLSEQFTTNFQSVILSGQAERVFEEQERRKALQSIVMKYSPEHSAEGYRIIDELIDRVAVVAVRIDRFSGKSK